MECESLKKVTLTGQIMEQIAGTIMSGQLKPGDKLLNKRDLAELFGVTRSQIREALGVFSLVGILIIKPGDGSFVSEEGTEAPEETVMRMYYQEMDRHDEIYVVRSLIETKVYLTCHDSCMPEILERLDGFGDRLLDVETEEIAVEVFCQPLADIDTYVGDVCGNGIYVGLIQIMMLVRKGLAMKILSPASFKESVVFYRCKILNSFHQDDKNKVEKCPNDFFKCSAREISIQE